MARRQTIGSNPLRRRRPLPRFRGQPATSAAGTGRVHLAARNYGSGPDLIVVANVPVVSCPYCGESYLTAETLHALQRITHPLCNVTDGGEQGRARAPLSPRPPGSERVGRSVQRPVAVAEFQRDHATMMI
jgi:hypothetical protein